MVKRKVTSRKAERYSAKNSVKNPPNRLVKAEGLVAQQLKSGSQQKDPGAKHLEFGDRSLVAPSLPVAPQTDSSAPAALSAQETCQLEIGVLRAAVETRFDELHRLTRSYQQMEAKTRAALQKLAASESLLAQREAALADVEAQLLLKNSEVLAAEKNRVVLTESFHAAVASTHPAKNIEQEMRKTQPKLRAKDMKRSEGWNLLKQSWLFDGDWYLARYPDVAQAAWDPVEHYLSFGANEHRDPGPFFSTASYLSENADVAEAKMNPLVHYIKFGCHELRRAVPRLTK